MSELDQPRVAVALDFESAEQATAFVARLIPGSCRLKVGKELFLRGGPRLVADWIESGWDVFLDLKFHDIPNTVAGACRAAADLGVWMINVHALGGPAMLDAAREAVDSRPQRPLLTAVTILTSHDAEVLRAVGLQGDPGEAVMRLASLTHDAGLDGVVCSAHEAEAIRTRFGHAFHRVTPGIRPRAAAAADQRRVMTPSAAVSAGATDLVIGRPVTRASDPVAILAAINREIAAATA